MTLIVGHRGARNLWPENSLSGFRRTLALGVDAIEFDVHRTSDGKLVVIHDPTLERTTFGEGAICDLSAETVCRSELRDADGECVPTLQDVLDLLKAASIELHIEIKTDAQGRRYDGIEAQILHMLVEHRMVERSVLTCFVPSVLEDIRRQWPEQRLLASLDRRSCEMLGGLDASLARFNAVSGCLLAVEKSLLQHALEPCLRHFGAERLGVWVVNEPQDLVTWSGAPIRQITTDRPDLALS